MSDRRFVTVHDHPAFAPNALPPAPRIHLPAAGIVAPTLGEVLFLPLDDIAKLPPGFLNLLCATMLPDTADLDLPACLRTFGEWVQFVRRETDRQLHKFHRSPGEYENSEAYFRALVMITALQRDLGVRYDPSCAGRREFRTSREGFIHGLLTGDRTGTCANMPVLYVAVGRALGYPIYLVAASGHLFCRWHDAKTGERFNIEASGQGLTTPTDHHYKTWPRPITEKEVYHGIFLRNLDPTEEFGHYMATRGHCLSDKGHLLDAIVAYAHAHRLAPTDPACLAFLLGAMSVETDKRLLGKVPGTYRQAELFNQRAGLKTAKFVIDSRYAVRAAGVNLADAKPGRLATQD